MSIEDLMAEKDAELSAVQGGAFSESGVAVNTAPSSSVFDELAAEKDAELSQKQPQEQGIFSDAWDAWSEFVTGANRRSALPREVRNLPEIAESPQGADPQIMFGLMSTVDPKAREDIIKAAVPEIEFERYDDSVVAVFPDGAKAFINKPGLSQQDLNTLAGQTLAYLTPARFTSLIKPLAGRILATSAAEGGVNFALQRGSQALGSEQPIDKSEVALASGLGALGEVAPAVLGVAGRQIEKVADTANIYKKVREGRTDDDTALYTLNKLPDKKPSELPVVPEEAGLGEVVRQRAKNIPFTEQRVVKSPAAEEALRQKVPPLMITRLRETNTPTRNAAKTVIDYHTRAVKAGDDVSPYEVIGRHFKNRVDVVMNKSKEAAKQQKEAVKTFSNIKGADLDEPLINIGFDITNSLDDAGIRVTPEGTLDFSRLQQGSPVRGAGEKELQKHWADIQNARNAEDLHNVKKNIQGKLKDSYKQKSNVQFDSQTESILNSWQKSINAQLREISPDYKQANDILSKNIKAIQQLEEAVPKLKKLNLDPDSPNISIEEMEAINKEVNTLLGQEFRKLDSNYGSAPKIDNAIDTFDDLAKEYGSEFDVDVKTLTKVLNSYKTRYGDRSGTFQGGIEAGTQRGNEDIASELQKIGKSQFFLDSGRAVLNALDPVSDVTRDNAYKASIDYIKEMNQRAK